MTQGDLFEDVTEDRLQAQLRALRAELRKLDARRDRVSEQIECVQANIDGRQRRRRVRQARPPGEWVDGPVPTDAFLRSQFRVLTEAEKN